MFFLSIFLGLNELMILRYIDSCTTIVNLLDGYVLCISRFCRFRDSKSKKLRQVRVAFQVSVKPGSYKIGPQSLGANEQIDPKFDNNEIEWLTKERGATVLSALLIKME